MFPKIVKNHPKKLFWKFEFFVFVIGSLSAYYTFCRMKLLDNEHDERIKDCFIPLIIIPLIYT